MLIRGRDNDFNWSAPSPGSMAAVLALCVVLCWQLNFGATESDKSNPNWGLPDRFSQFGGGRFAHVTPFKPSTRIHGFLFNGFGAKEANSSIFNGDVSVACVNMSLHVHDCADGLWVTSPTPLTSLVPRPFVVI